MSITDFVSSQSGNRGRLLTTFKAANLILAYADYSILPCLIGDTDVLHGED